MSTNLIDQDVRRQQAEQRLLVIRNALEVADAELERALVERDWEVFGLTSFEEYCAEKLPEMQHIRLKAPARRRRAQALRDKGATIPAIVAATGSSLGTIHRDLNPAPSFQMETAQPVQEPATAPPAPVSGYRAAAALVTAQGERGLTYVELCEQTGWRGGQATGALSKAHDKHLIKPTTTFRDGCAAYVADYGKMGA